MSKSNTLTWRGPGPMEATEKLKTTRASLRQTRAALKDLITAIDNPRDNVALLRALSRAKLTYLGRPLRS